MSQIDKKLLEHLAELARIELDTKEESKMLTDLEKVLSYFKELEEVNTESVPPQAGGTDLKNVLREDKKGREAISGERAREQFTEIERDFLKIPPVFPAEGGSASGGE